MTRSQRIALAMWGKQPARCVQNAMSFDWQVYVDWMRHTHRCYEALDDLDPYQDVNPSEAIVFVRGNYGLPCS